MSFNHSLITLTSLLILLSTNANANNIDNKASLTNTSAAHKKSPNLGKPLTNEQVDSISITVLPNGVGLSKGTGNAIQGKILYQAKCLACHGQQGTGGTAPKLTGGKNQAPFWSTGASWPYATSIFDYIRRAMPPSNVKSLSADEVYALTAYILAMNNIIDDKKELSHNNLAEIKMPSQAYMSSKWQTEEKAIFKSNGATQ